MIQKHLVVFHYIVASSINDHLYENNFRSLIEIRLDVDWDLNDSYRSKAAIRWLS